MAGRAVARRLPGLLRLAAATRVAIPDRRRGPRARGTGQRRFGPGRARGPAVVVVSVDPLRADAALGMATFKRLAARGAAWERAMSTSSWTLPALASLRTGRMPAEHGAGCLEDAHCQGIFPGVRL